MITSWSSCLRAAMKRYISASPSRSIPVVRISLAHPLAELGAARFAKDDRLMRRELLAQELDLRGLSRAFDALESDEEAAGH